MDRSAAKVIPHDELIFHDGLGDRLLVRDTQGRPLHETLLLRAELTGVPSFEFALTQRMTQLDKFEHAAFVPVRQLIRLPGQMPRVSLVSEYVPGTRLSDVLAIAEQTGKPISTGAAFFLIKEILGALAALHRQSSDISHGAVAPERILIVDGKVRITDYTLGSAIEQLRYSPERYWKDLRVTVPPAAGGMRFDRRVDVAQVGMIAVALLASRPLRDAESISGLGDVLMGLTQTTDGTQKSLSLPLRGWLIKSLHMDLRRTFTTAGDAEQALDDAMTEAGVKPARTELDIASTRPQRIAAIAPKSAAPNAVPVVPQTPVKKTMAPLRAPATEAWNGTIVASAPEFRIRISPRIKGLFKLGALAALIAGTFTAAQYIPPPAKLFSSTGTLVVDSSPVGVQVIIDHQPQGVTPMTLKLKAGRHEVELRGLGKTRVFNVFVTKGDSISQYIEFPIPRPRPRK